MRTTKLSAFTPCVSRPINRLWVVSFLVSSQFGAFNVNAATIYNVTSIGQPIQLSFGNDPGQLAFTGNFNIGSEQLYNFERLRSVHGNAYGISGDFAAGLLGAATVNSVYDPDFEETTTTITDGLFSHSITNYRLTAGNSILNGGLPINSTINRYTWVATTPLSVGWSTVGAPVATASGQPPIASVAPTSPYAIREATLTTTKNFDMTTVDAVATLNFSALYPQGAAAQMGLQVRQQTGEAQVNTSDVYLRAQPGIVSPAANFTTATNSLFRWDLKGNTAAGPGTNWTQINFADKVATFTEGTQFVIAFDTTTNFLDPFWSQNRSWDIFNGGSITGAGADDFLANLNFTFIGGLNRPSDIPNGYNASKFSSDQTTGTLNWTAIPEPTSALSGILLAAGLMRRRRR